MRLYATLALAAALSGCSTLPSPTEALPPGSAQVRLSELHGEVEAGRIAAGGAATGSSCVLTVMGALPAGVRAAMAQGGCYAEIGGDR